MRTIFLAVGLSALVFAPLAYSEELTVRIPVMASDIATPQALENLYGRVEAAAESVCGRSTLTPLSLMNSRNTCRREVIAEAIEAANIPALTAYHTAEIAPVVSETQTLAAR